MSLVQRNKRRNNPNNQSGIYYSLDWHDINKPPPGQCSVLIMASCENYQFNHPQLFAGFYIDKYYDTPINEFRITGVGKEWTPVKWAYAPKTP